MFPTLGHELSILTKLVTLTLAQLTSDIDLIIGGHTHTFLKEPVIIKNKKNNNVIINQVGSGGVYLGRIDFNFTNSSKRNTNSLLEL